MRVAIKCAMNGAEGSFKTILGDMTIGALNQKQTIKAPASSRPLEQLVQQFGGSLPGLGGTGSSSGSSSGAGSSSGGTSGSSSGGQSSEYLNCVQQAGQDVEKLQQCSDLIGK